MKKIYLVAESGRPKEILDAWRQEFLDYSWKRIPIPLKHLAMVQMLGL